MASGWMFFWPINLLINNLTTQHVHPKRVQVAPYSADSEPTSEIKAVNPVREDAIISERLPRWWNGGRPYARCRNLTAAVVRSRGCVAA